MWNCSDLLLEANNYIKNNPGFIKFYTANGIDVVGSLEINDGDDRFIYKGRHQVRITLPFSTNKLPEIYDISFDLKSIHEHRYTDGSLCLETDVVIKDKFSEYFNLQQWVSEVVIPYYWSNFYYERFQKFPFGERSHGLFGLIEGYKQVFGLDDSCKALKIMSIDLTNESYKKLDTIFIKSATFKKKEMKSILKYLNQNSWIAYVMIEDYRRVVSTLYLILLMKIRKLDSKNKLTKTLYSHYWVQEGSSGKIQLDSDIISIIINNIIIEFDQGTLDITKYYKIKNNDDTIFKRNESTTSSKVYCGCL